MLRSITGPRAIALISCVAALSGCTTNKDKVFDTKNAPTMVDIYENHLARAGKPYTTSVQDVKDRKQKSKRKETVAATPEPVSDDYQRLIAYSRTPTTETLNLFPTLPNPVLVMYVHPHLAGEEGLPVPGYATAFTLYEKTQFALPGEATLSRSPSDPFSPAGAPITASPEIAPRDDRLINAAFSSED